MKSSKSEASSSLPDFVTVGRVRKPHGIHGEVVVSVLTDIDSRFAADAVVDLVDVSGVRHKARMTSVRRSKGAALVRFDGVDTRDAAEVLRGATLEIARDQVPPAPGGSYYFFQLVGCDCTDRFAGHLGLVKEVLEDGGGLLLEVDGDSGQLLVPFVESYVRDVNIEGRKIELELPQGLIEVCTSRF